jgi:uncharacterized protein (TIGR00297 family)
MRGYFNVFANGLVASAASILFGITHHPMFIALFLGSVATAAADTVAGEIGLLSLTPYLITTWEPVPPGTETPEENTATPAVCGRKKLRCTSSHTTGNSKTRSV